MKTKQSQMRFDIVVSSLVCTPKNSFQVANVHPLPFFSSSLAELDAAFKPLPTVFLALIRPGRITITQKLQQSHGEQEGRKLSMIP